MSVMSPSREYTRENAGAEPDGPGVYELLDECEDELYIGSGRLRSSLLGWISSGRIPGVSYYRAEPAGTMRDAEIRRDEELWMVMRTYGCHPHFNREDGPISPWT